MNPHYVETWAITPACRLLAGTYPSARIEHTLAKVQLLAIALLESDGLRARHQYNKGPGRGLWQFEDGPRKALDLLMHHPQTEEALRKLCEHFIIRWQRSELMLALTYNDIFAAGVARLLLWTIPRPLPPLGNTREAWEQYLEAWRPGKPQATKWPQCYHTALLVFGLDMPEGQANQHA